MKALTERYYRISSIIHKRNTTRTKTGRRSIYGV